ncbi:MAG: DUF11 domain-containing protein, partial [Anaerolineae bacterium]|nr:DUF11 domain-containing protein [Anaerolineae bacterium]
MRTLHSLTGALSSNRARLVLVIAVVVGLLALASAGFAINITAITPSWSAVTGSSGAPDCLYLNNLSSPAEVRFGDNDTNPANPCPAPGQQSGLGITAGANGVFTNGTPFVLGELTHFNNQVFASSQLTGATLNFAIASSAPVAPSISTAVTVTETANNLVTCPFGDTPPCADQISMTPSAVSFTEGAGNYQLEILGLIPGTAGSCTFNPANLQLSLISEEDSNTTACVFGRVTQSNEAELQIEKSTPATVLVPGEIVEFQIDYSCASTTASCLDVLLTDFLPPQLEYVSSTGSIHTTNPLGQHTPGSNTVLFDFIDPLPAGSTGFVTILARVTNNGTLANGQAITNTATSTISNGETNTTSTTTPVQTMSAWDVQKTGDATAYISTEPPITDMTYTVQICPNGSNVNLRGAVMVDTLPPGATFVSATGGGTFTAPNTVSWDLGELKASDPCATRNVVVRFTNPALPAPPLFVAGQTVINTVNASGTPIGEPLWTDSATLPRVLQDFVPNPNMTLNKGTARTDYIVGAQVDYALTPRNSGNTNLYNLVMTDNVPDQLRVTAIEVGGSAYPVVVEYAINGSGSYTVWPGSPFNSNQTLNVAALGLGPNDWVTSVRWRFNPGFSTPPGWSLSPAARIIGTITSPDRLGAPVVVGSQVINHATIGWEYLPGGVGPCTNPGGVCGSTGSPNATIDIVAVPVPVFDKTSGGGAATGQRFIIGQQVGYFDLSVNNNTGIAVDSFTITDDIPAQFNVTSVNVGTFTPWSGTVGLRYQVNDSGTWVNWPGTPFAESAAATAPVLGAGQYISDIEFSYGTVPNGFRGAPRIFGATLATDRNGVPVADGATMTNNGAMSWVYQGVPSSRTDVTNDPIRLPTVTPVANKTVTSTPPFIPTSAVNFRLGVGAAPSSPSNVMNNPIVSDLLPVGVNYVSYTYDNNGTLLPAPVLTQIPNFNGTGRTMLRWTFTGSLNRGEMAYINLNTTLAAGTLAGNLTNEVRVAVTDMPVNGGVPDAGDWDGVGGSGNSVSTGSVTIAVAPLVGLDSHKSVRGELDSSFSAFPSYGQTVANGDVDYRLYIVNRGNVPINNVRVIDILPFVGDTGVRDLRARHSAWRPVLTTPVTPQAGVTVYYSTSGNPCRPEVVSSGPPGCSIANWSLVPPANIGDTQSLRFDFAGTLLPGQSFTFQWGMRAPATAPANSIAWNSFAFASTNADTGVPLFPAEPNKVGTYFRPDVVPLIDIEKHTNGFDADQPTGPLVPTNGVVNWDYFVTNTSPVALENIVVTDSDPSVVVTCPQTTLAAGATMTCTASDSTPQLGQYANIGSVTGQSVVNGTVVTDEDPSHYFGYDPLLARLGDFTWIDLNANGIQEAGEPPLGGVTVRLLDSAGAPVDDPNQSGNQPYVTTTDASGFYQFVNLPAGTYRVQFDVPFPYTLTLPNQGGNDALDSDADPFNGITGPVTLAAGESNQTVDAGFVARAALGDRVWLDSNGNGIQDASETATGPVGGLLVQLMSADGTTVLASTFTDAAGNYVFTELPPGDYRVRFPVPPAGYLWTTPNAGSDPALDSDVIPSTRLTAVTNLIAGEVDPTWDAGLVPVASLGDRVWYDNDFDGIQDAGEPGVPGVTVRLLDASGNQATRDDGSLIPDVVTDANGLYSFTGLRPGVPYEVRFTRPANTLFTAQNAGSNDALDSDAIESGPNMGRTGQTTLTPGQNDTRWDAGLIRLASLGDFVWYDNNNGQQDSGEPGVPGAVVTLLDAAGNPVTQDALGGTISSITTPASGFYSFTNLDPRMQYIVQFQRPADTNFATPNTGNDATDSDAVPSGSLPLGIGRSGVITLSAGENDMTIDAGVVPDSSLGNFVWYDNNNDGIQTAGEPGVPNVTVQLLNSDFSQATDERGNAIPDQVTDANGLYLFPHLRPGSYVVRFLPATLPTGYTFARTGQGTAATGSDPNRFTGRTGTIALGVNVDDMRWDAGVVTEAALGNFVWEDINADGLQGGPSELGVANVTVRLLDGSGNQVDNPNTNAINDYYEVTTDANGYYGFTGL